jgi:hypothetical protein
MSHTTTNYLRRFEKINLHITITEHHKKLIGDIVSLFVMILFAVALFIGVTGDTS